MSRLVLIMAFILTQGVLYAQQQERVSKFSVYASAGPNLYLNNFDYFKKLVEPVHFNFGARIMWEPEHRLAIGLKTGYYKMYTVNFQGSNNAKIDLSAIPIHTFFTMKLYKGFYAHFGMGPTVFLNKISNDTGEKLSYSYLSLADVTGGFGYIQRPRKGFSFGAELEYFHASKADDHLLSLSFLARLPL